MGTDDEKTKHNPDSENLKSLLKKADRKEKKNNRVIFNENKNEFFDADYIILIREECEYDDEDDDSVCTCNQHELVHLACCEPGCDCNEFEECEQTPQSPKFAPPIEFVDAVTLSPPEGYKDVETEEQQLVILQRTARKSQRTAVCRECSANYEEGHEGISTKCYSKTVTERKRINITAEKEKIDQSQQTTPTSPSHNSEIEDYCLEEVTKKLANKQNILHQVEDDTNITTALQSVDCPALGILKGGQLWKHQEINSTNKCGNIQNPERMVTSDDESCNRRSVRFIELEEKKQDLYNELLDQVLENKKEQFGDTDEKTDDMYNNLTLPDTSEMMLTFKLGNHVLVSNNSLKPNSAVRQLFPCAKPLVTKDAENNSPNQYLITTESLCALEEAKRLKVPQVVQTTNTNENIKRVIERNCLRRSLIRYEPKNKKNVQKVDNSLVERIKQLTCNVDDDIQDLSDVSARVSPVEEPRQFLEVSPDHNKLQDKTYSPSSSSTSSNSSSASSTYKKITDLFSKKEKPVEVQTVTDDSKAVQTLPDIGAPHNQLRSDTSKCKVGAPNESRKQFLSTLAPLTACVSNMKHSDESHYSVSNAAGERTSLTSTVYTNCTLENVDEGFKVRNEHSRGITPDVLTGTPLSSDSGDELAVFVHQDASRINRIKKKYQPEHQPNNKDEDDEHDDYGFNKRPSVQGIKPQFETATKILQQIHDNLQFPTAATTLVWPYYSESSLSGTGVSNKRNINQNVSNLQYCKVPEKVNDREFSSQYHSAAIRCDNFYGCPTQRFFGAIYKSNLNACSAGVEEMCNATTPLPRTRYNRSLSPPPQEISKNYHQTMVYIPYNHLENYQPILSPSAYYQPNEVFGVSAQNQINERYAEPVHQQKMHHVEGNACNPNVLSAFTHEVSKASFANPYQPHLPVSAKSDSNFLSPFSATRSTQTSAISVSTYNKCNEHFRYTTIGSVWKGSENYVTKTSPHAFPSYQETNKIINVCLKGDGHYGQVPNGFRHPLDVDNYLPPADSGADSPTKRGAPEDGAVLSAACIIQDTNGTVVAENSNSKLLFYAMNV